MAESRQIAEKTEAFRARFPEAEGWRVYCIDLEAVSLFTPFLPSFLRAKAPKSVAREEITTMVSWRDAHGSWRRSLSAPPWVRPGAGFQESDWIGEIELDWRGSPIIYQRHVVMLPREFQTLTLIAAKDRKALEDLWSSAARHERSLRGRGRSIWVIGEGMMPLPKKGWEDIVLTPAMLGDIRLNTESFLRAKAEYARLKLPYRRGFLLTGPPGGGKTLAAQVIASNCRGGVRCLPLKAELTDAAVSTAFHTRGARGLSVLILEDLDRIVHAEKVSMSHLLNLMDGTQAPDGLLVIATANHPEKLDQALLHRPSRFDRVWHFGLPAYPERLRLLKMRSMGRFSGETLEAAASETEGFTMAYVQEAVVSALLRAVHERRPPADLDLRASVRMLKEQYREAFKADGAVTPPIRVGFAAAPGALNGGDA